MKKLYLMTLTVALSAVLCSCGSSAVGSEPNGGDPKNEEDNPYKALELTGRSVDFVRQGDAFSFGFLDRVNAATQEDYIISPLSMQFLLGMLLDGARGETAAQICNVLGYGADETASVNEYCLSMIGQLPAMDKKTQLSIAGAIFVDDGYPLLDSYKSDVARYYKATVSNLDFANGAIALKKINGWCAEQTNGMIPKILDEVTPDMLAYLLNAVYFKSQWQKKFDKRFSADEKFTTEAGAVLQVKMMKQKSEYSYHENDLWQAVRLPYGNGAFSMTVLLPKAGHQVADITAALKGSDAQSLSRGHICEVDLWLPKFESDFHINLNKLLSEMGMPLSFSREADFKAMSEYAMCLSFVQQDAAIKVDEEGTEAAAVSSAGMLKATSVGPQKEIIFHADHPFLYLITESSTGAVLFAGRYSGGK